MALRPPLRRQGSEEALRQARQSPSRVVRTQRRRGTSADATRPVSPCSAAGSSKELRVDGSTASLPEGREARRTTARPVLTFTGPPRHLPRRAPRAVSDYHSHGTRPSASASPTREGSGHTPRQEARVFHSPGTLGAPRPSASLKRHTLGAPGLQKGLRKRAARLRALNSRLASWKTPFLATESVKVEPFRGCARRFRLRSSLRELLFACCLAPSSWSPRTVPGSSLESFP